MALMYCKKCGRIAQESYGKLARVCDCCKSNMYDVPKKYLDDEIDIVLKDYKETKQLLIDELVKTSPEFDQYFFDKRDDILAGQRAEYEATMAIGRAVQNGVKPKDAFKGNFLVAKCPSCSSTNVSKISTLNRMVSTGLFGLASSKIGKTHKCNNCGTTW